MPGGRCGCMFTITQLDQCQFGVISGFAMEFGIYTQKSAMQKLLAAGLKGFLCVNVVYGHWLLWLAQKGCYCNRNSKGYFKE